MKTVKMYTDGACRGNPGPGGWGVLLCYSEHQKQLYGAELHTTNNRMELMAAIEGLAALKKSCVIELTTDSQYLRDGITKWLPQWKKNGWRTAQKKPIKNMDLWQRLEQEASRHHVKWHWVRGHIGPFEK